MKQTIIVFLLLFTVACTHAESLTEWVDSAVKSELTTHNKPSAAIGIISDGQISYTQGYGTLTRDSAVPVTSSSPFQIASVSKMFTGIIVSHLIDEGTLSLDEYVTTYLGHVLTEQTQSSLAEMTLGHLMQHTAGVPTYASSVYLKAKEGGKFYWTKGYSKDELIADINTMTLEFSPGTEQSYSNSGYNIVGLILEERTGLSYEQLIQRYISGPLELKNTFVTPTARQSATIVTPYPPSSPLSPARYSDWGYATPASGVFSTVDDLLKIMSKQLTAYRSLSTDASPSPYVLTRRADLNNELEFHYGLGFFERQGPNGETLLQHDGDADGYTVFYTLAPERNMGKVLITSSGGDWFLTLDEKLEKQLFH